MSGPATEAATETGIPVENPATGETIATVAELGPGEVGAMVARAREAQPIWAAIGFEGRAEVLLAARDWMVANAERVVTTIVGETGRPADETQFAELAYGLSALEFWAKAAPGYLADEEVQSASPFVRGRRLVVRYAPLGVVGVIGPWNYPLNNSFGDCIPALAAGNAVVLKPSEVTPLTSLLMAQMLAECGIPEGAFQVATGRGETGAALVDEVDMVMFTGSVETGKRVMARAAQTLTPVSLELGGKDPMIVLADADLERAANAAVSYGMNNSGQVCISVERVYVEEPVYDEFLIGWRARSRRFARVRPGAAGSVDVGAMIFPPQIELIEAHVRDAVAKGARVVTGGKRAAAEPGRFFEPTVLAEVDHSMRCMTEETFGPTLPVMRVGDAQEAVRLANDGPYGLQASVWTRDTANGERIARQVEAGVCCVNDAQLNYGALELPMGGWKASGLGSRHGPDGIRKYAKRQSLMITPGYAPPRELHMFPYSARSPSRLARSIAALATEQGVHRRAARHPGGLCDTLSRRWRRRPRATRPAIRTASGRERPRTWAFPRRSRSALLQAERRRRSSSPAWARCSTRWPSRGWPPPPLWRPASRSSRASPRRARCARRDPHAARPRRLASSTRSRTSARGGTRTGTRSAIRGRRSRPAPSRSRSASAAGGEPRRRSRRTCAWSARARAAGWSPASWPRRAGGRACSRPAATTTRPTSTGSSSRPTRTST